MKKYFNKAKAATAAVVLFPAVAMAAAPDFSGLTDQIDFSSAITAILLVCGALAGVYIVMKGANLILIKLRGN